MLIIGTGAVHAVIGLIRPKHDLQEPIKEKKVVWLHFGVWLLLGLEFSLAADIIRTAISPSWTDIGQLAAIAVIRTFLNYFLERDLGKYVEPKPPARSESANENVAEPNL